MSRLRILLGREHYEYCLVVNTTNTAWSSTLRVLLGRQHYEEIRRVDKSAQIVAYIPCCGGSTGPTWHQKPGMLGYMPQSTVQCDTGKPGMLGYMPQSTVQCGTGKPGMLGCMPQSTVQRGTGKPGMLGYMPQSTVQCDTGSLDAWIHAPVYSPIGNSSNCYQAD